MDVRDEDTLLCLQQLIFAAASDAHRDPAAPEITRPAATAGGFAITTQSQCLSAETFLIHA